MAAPKQVTITLTELEAEAVSRALGLVAGTYNHPTNHRHGWLDVRLTHSATRRALEDFDGANMRAIQRVRVKLHRAM